MRIAIYSLLLVRKHPGGIAIYWRTNDSDLGFDQRFRYVFMEKFK